MKCLWLVSAFLLLVSSVDAECGEDEFINYNTGTCESESFDEFDHMPDGLSWIEMEDMLGTDITRSQFWRFADHLEWLTSVECQIPDKNIDQNSCSGLTNVSNNVPCL